MKKIIVSFVLGAVIFGSVGAMAAYYQATDNVFPIKLDGIDVKMEGYNIDGRTYFKLRDMAELLGGFSVDFKDDTILIARDKSAETDSGSGISFKVPEDSPIAEQVQDKAYEDALFYNEFIAMRIRKTQKGAEVDACDRDGVLKTAVINTMEDYIAQVEREHYFLEGMDGEGFVYYRGDVTSETHSGIDMRRMEYQEYNLDDEGEEPSAQYTTVYYLFETDGCFYQIRFNQRGTELTESTNRLISTVLNSITVKQ